jgi:peptide chain release factor subunit 1
MRTASSTALSLSEAAGLRSDGHRILSVYLDLDPTRFPHLRDRQAELDAVLDEAERRYLDGGELTHTERAELRADIDRVREALGEQGALSPPLARGLAIFCSEPAGVLEIARLPRAVAPLAVVAARPFIEPLAELAAAERWCVLLVSRRSARIFRGTRERLRELPGVLDDVHRHHAQGGWSQARYQRGIEHEVDEHVRASCELLLEQFRRQPFERLLIGGPSELRQRIRQALDADLCARLVGHLEIDVERSSADTVHRRALPGIEASERWREEQALERLREGMAPSGHASAGLEEVLELLNERRVASLLLAAGLAASGLICPRCGWLLAGADTGECPACGAALERREDVIEGAIESALAQDAEVLVFHHGAEGLAGYGGIAALLRY